MKSIQLKHSWLSSLFFVLLALICIHCGGKSTEQSQTQIKETPSHQPHASTEAKIPVKNFYIDDVNNAAVAEIAIDAQETVISSHGTTLFGIQKREDKRKYYDQNDAFRYAIKYKGDDFKLRDSTEQLLWKVKIKEGKIKIANNEEMEHPYEIKKYEGRIKLEKDGSEIQAIRYEKEATQLTADKYVIRNFNSSFAPGVFLIPDMSDLEKTLISAELARRNQ